MAEDEVTLIPVNSPFVQVAGGAMYQVNVETTARQVKTQDGMNVEVRLNTLEAALSGKSTIRFADDIAARDAMTGLLSGDIVVVTDATADASVEKGGARYILLSTGGFRKISEDESMDIEFKWENIEDRPESTVEQIDMAVAKQHRHDNAEVLARLADADGALTYKGKAVQEVWGAMVTNLANIPTNLADGGFIVLNMAAASAEITGGSNE